MGDEAKEISDIVKTITFEDVDLIFYNSFSKKLKEFRLGINLPLHYKISHLWTSKENQEALSQKIKGLQDNFSSSAGGAFCI